MRRATASASRACPLGLGDPVWIDDEGFDARDHVLPAGHSEFEQLVDDGVAAEIGNEIDALLERAAA